MKKFISFIVLTLTLVMALSVILTGCNNDKKEENIVDIKENEYVSRDTGSIETSSIPFITNGTTEYVVIVPSETSSFDSFSATEMQYFVEEATGFSLTVLKDNDGQINNNTKFISIGNTTQFLAKNISIENINFSGYTIQTIDENVYIGGQSGNGVLQGVYRFLNTVFGYKYYAQDEFYIMETANATLPVFSLVHNPAVPIGQAAYLSQESDIQYIRRTGLLSKYDIWMMAGNSSEGWTHNTYLWVNPSIYNNPSVPETYHPEWFGGGDLCYTRDEGDNNDEMFQIILQGMEEQILNGGDKVLLSLTQNDSEAWCTCGKCQAEAAKYGNSNLAIIIKYANRLITEINKWKAQNVITKEVKLGIFAYQKTLDAPVKEEKVNGEYVPLSEDVICHDDVMIEFAPLRMAMHKDFYSEANKGFADIFLRLRALTKNLGCWWYGTYFHTYLIPLNNFEAMQKTVQFFCDSGVFWSFQEGQATNGSVCFEQLRIYLISKLYDDPYSPYYNEWIDDFFDNYYKDASKPMREYFESFRLVSTDNRDNNGLSGDVGANPGNREFFTYPVLKQWLNCIEDSYLAIEKYKGTDLYSKLYDRICRESLSIRYLLIELYPENFDEKELLEMKRSFKNDCTRLGIVRVSNSAYMQDVYNSWEI